jgi:carbonic anhydrase
VIYPSVPAEPVRPAGRSCDAGLVFPLVPDPTAPPALVGGLSTLGTGLPQFVPSGLAAPADHDPAACSLGPDGPDEALAELLAGNARFVAGHPRYGHSVAAARAVAARPDPFAVVVGCIDSRVPIEAVFDQDFGAVCAVRSAAHVLDRAALASVEFAVEVLEVDLVLVLGHRHCAAVVAAVDAVRAHHRPHGYLGYVVDEIKPAVHGPELHRDDVADLVTHRHTVRSVARLRALLGEDGVRVTGAYYDVETGAVDLHL